MEQQKEIVTSSPRECYMPTDDEVAAWYDEVISKTCSPSSAIYLFRQWLKERAAALPLPVESTPANLDKYALEGSFSKTVYMPVSEEEEKKSTEDSRKL